MTRILRLFAVIAVLGGSIFLSAQNPTPVVVELFTSEGCSSCPPADANLVQLSHRSPSDGILLVLLGEHVDYWNYIGWTDRFSSSQFSHRQGDYTKTLHLASAYTPQMVIDGHIEFAAGDMAEVNQKIQAAAKDPKPDQVGLQWEGNNRLHVTVQSPTPSRARVLLAVTEDGLSTQVGSGENGGRTLHHAAVVRELHDLGTVDKSQFQATADVSAHKDWNPSQLKVAVLVQDTSSGKILGAAMTNWLH